MEEKEEEEEGEEEKHQKPKIVYITRKFITFSVNEITCLNIINHPYLMCWLKVYG